MRLRTLIIVSIFTVIIVGLSSYAVGYHLKHRYDPVSLASVKADGKAGEKCAEANRSLKLTAQAQQSIANAAVQHIKDLPANTRADVSVASYEAGKSATGYVSYNNDNGSYNFTLKPNDPSWQVTSFKACDK